MIQVQKGFTPRFGALRSEPDGSTSLQRSQRVRSMEMDEVIRVKAKVVTSEGDLGRFWGGKIWKNLGKSWKNGTCHGKLMRTNLEHVMENVEIDAEKWLDKWRCNGKISHGKCVMDFFFDIIGMSCWTERSYSVQAIGDVMSQISTAWLIHRGLFFFPWNQAMGMWERHTKLAPSVPLLKKQYRVMLALKHWVKYCIKCMIMSYVYKTNRFNALV